MNLGPNSPCHCGSGRKYKHCHRLIDEAPPEDRYQAGQLVYSRNWSATAKEHYTNKHYAWMANILLPFQPKRIFDVGCGSGHGLLSLFEVFGADHLQVVSVDENGTCLNTACQTLRQAKISADLVKRLRTILTPFGYAHEAAPIEKQFTVPCTLVESDICNDDQLEKALLESGPFDAVTIWLTGTHMMRPQHSKVIARRIKSDGGHRLYVQNKVYEIAGRILRKGGVLQVVDRGEAPTSDLLRQDSLAAHRDEASVTSLEVMDLQFMIYEEPKGNRTPMKLTPGTSGRVPEKT
jgi:SAM-dependent methyltransferase